MAPSQLDQVHDAVATVDFTIVFGEILALIPVVLPVMISFIAVRKGINFVLSALRGA